MPSPKDTKGPIVKTGPTKGQNRSRKNDGQWRKKREDSGKSKEKKKGFGCFISTVACHFMGLPDDCYELQLLRSFRDEYLIKTPEGEMLVARYYLEAPEIAAKLTQPEDLEYAWSSIAACVRLIEEKNYEETVELYQKMFLNIKSRFQNTENQ